MAASSPSVKRPSTGPPGTSRSTGPWSAWRRPRRARATGSSPPTAASSPSATPRSTGPPAACTSTARSSAWPPRPTARLLARRLRRRRLRLRRRRVLRLDRRHQPQPARSSAWPRRPTVTATGSSRPTAASSPSATPRSTVLGNVPSTPSDRLHHRRCLRSGVLVHQQQRCRLRLRERHVLGIDATGARPAPRWEMAQAAGTGRFTGSSYPSGSFGYDISKSQCPSLGGTLPPAPHTIGIVQVEASGFSVNPCLSQQAAWAGAGLNLYVYLNYGNAGSSGDPACQVAADPSSCNYGFNAAIHPIRQRPGRRVNTQVAWWSTSRTLRHGRGASSPTRPWCKGPSTGSITKDSTAWVSTPALGVWSVIVGDYTPPVPYWAGDWGIDPATTCSNVHSLYPVLPSGPVQIVQYSSPHSAVVARWHERELRRRLRLLAPHAVLVRR